MTDDRTQHPDPNTPPAPIDPASMNRAELIRAAADGEVPMDRIPASDRTRVEFERALRQAVDRVSPDATAPDHLRASIMQAFREHAPPAAAAPVGASDSRATTSPSFWNRAPRWLGVAALLALCATVVVMSIRTGYTTFGGHQGAIKTASFIQREADSCTQLDEHFNAKFRARSMDEARDLATSIFQKTPEALLRADDALTAMGYRFAGFGRCAVPGPGDSAHLIYHADANHADALSLFIQQESDALALERDCCYLLPGGEASDDRVVAWREDGFIYYLFSHNPTAIDTARSIFQAPQRQITLR